MSTSVSVIATPFGNIDLNPGADVRENLRVSFSIICDALNKNEVTKYSNQFQGWLVGRQAHPDLYPDNSAPQPPKSYVVVQSGDSYDYQQVGAPVCAMPAIPNLNIHPDTSADAQKEYLKQHRPMNTAAGETADNPPVGTMATDPSDGSTWKKILVGITPFGKAVEWQKQ